MVHMVLVGGAGLGAWAWERVTPLLEKAGHRVDTHTLRGVGERVAEGDADTGLQAHVEDLATALQRFDDPVVLVAHSYAGAVACGAARRMAERILHGVWLAGAVLAPGQCLYDLMPPEARGMIEELAAAGGGHVPFMAPDLLDALFGAHGLDVDGMARLQGAATAMPVATFREALDVEGELTVARTYVHCVGDGPDAPVDATTPGWGRRDLPAGHWPMLTLPQRTAALLDDLATAAG